MKAMRPLRCPCTHHSFRKPCKTPAIGAKMTRNFFQECDCSGLRNRSARIDDLKRWRGIWECACVPRRSQKLNKQKKLKTLTPLSKERNSDDDVHTDMRNLRLKRAHYIFFHTICDYTPYLKYYPENIFHSFLWRPLIAMTVIDVNFSLNLSRNSFPSTQ